MFQPINLIRIVDGLVSMMKSVIRLLENSMQMAPVLKLCARIAVVTSGMYLKVKVSPRKTLDIA